MKFLTLLLAAQGALAFPRVMDNVLEKRAADITYGSSGYRPGCEVSSACQKPLTVTNADIGYNPKTPNALQLASKARTNCGAQGACLTFNPTTQYVSNTGAYAYQSPSASQIRGPCPGLNAASNHGYLPRSGVATIVETITGLGSMYSMAADLAGFLAAYAVIFDGDIVSGTWSIGGPQQVIGVPGVDAPQGISYSHNKYEGDTSIGRCDAYINNGDAHSLSTTRFGYAYAATSSADRYTLDSFSINYAQNTIRSIKQNPYYFTGLFSTTLVSPAAYNFVINFMSNHSAAEPSGYLNGAMFKEFFAVSGEPGSFVWHPGQERLPDNWYRRPEINAYEAAAGVFGDLGAEFAAYPDTFRFGGNTNGVNTYNAFDFGTFTGGAITNQNVNSGNNFQCLIYQFIQQGVPDEGKSLFNTYIGVLLNKLSCPAITKFNDNNLNGAPGHSYSPSGPANNC